MNTRKRTYSISKRFATMLMMMIMVGSKALACDSYKVIDGLRYLLNPDSQSGLLFDKDSYEIAVSKKKQYNRVEEDAFLLDSRLYVHSKIETRCYRKKITEKDG